MEGYIVGYKWEVWYGGSCLREDDTEYETEDEAKEDAIEFCKERIEQWKEDGAVVEDGDYEELIKGIVIDEVVEEFEEDV